MKKLRLIFITILIIATALFAFAGCENKNGKDDNNLESGSNVDIGGEENFESDFESALQILVEAHNGNTENLKTTAPQAFWEWLEQNQGQTFDDIISLMNQKVESYIRMFGEDYKASYSITDKAELNSDKLLELGSDIKAKYGIEISVLKGYDVNFKLIIESGDKKDTTLCHSYIINIDNNWYLYTSADGFGGI